MFGSNVALLFSLVIAIPFAIAIAFFKKFTPVYKTVAALCICGALTEAAFVITSEFGRNLYLHHFLVLSEILIWSVFYMRILDTPEERKTIRIFMVGLSVFVLVYASIGNNFVSFNSLPSALESLYLCSLSCYLFYRMSMDYSIGDDGIYFVNGAVFFYFASNFVVFVFAKYKETDNDDLLIMFNIHSIVDSSCNLAYARGLWLASRSSYSVA
jgi:hypothetical protein